MNTITKIRTEDTGKIFEKAICLAYGIDYDGPFKYSLEKAEQLKSRLTKLPELFPKCSHTAKRGARYDFTAIDDPTKHLSAKTTKKGVGKVAPQVVGQSQPQKFCDTIGIPFTDVAALKKYIQENIATVLPVLVDYTFDCPNLFYNEEKNEIRFITLRETIDWSVYEFSWTQPHTTWNNSSSLKIKIGGAEHSLVEFQFHTKSRTNMAVRWSYDTFLTLFRDNLNITLL
jgi:hypothetical protein